MSPLLLLIVHKLEKILTSPIFSKTMCKLHTYVRIKYILIKPVIQQACDATTYCQLNTNKNKGKN